MITRGRHPDRHRHGTTLVELSAAEPRQMFVIRATLNYNDIAIVPMPFLKDVVLNSQAFMRHE